jgi:outer membrane cobalamin receptor
MKKINLSLKIFGSLFISFFTGLMVAQEIDSPPGLDSMPSQTLAEVVVTANRYGSLRIKTPEAIRVIDSKTIQKFQLHTAPEALLLTPGVFVQKTNHGGGSPFLRGLTGNQTLLLVDGIRLSNAVVRYGPNQYFNTIDVFSIEKLEVLRGNGSVQYGSDALGGTIQTFSHELSITEKSSWGSTLLTRIATQGMEQSLLNLFNHDYRFHGSGVNGYGRTAFLSVVVSI